MEKELTQNLVRKLGKFEATWAQMDNFVPVIFVGALHLKNGPAPEVMQAALETLQSRNQALQIKLLRQNREMFFVTDKAKIKMARRERLNDETWRTIVEDELNTPINTDCAPLFRATYLYGEPNSELVISFHHTIVDNRSGMVFVDELLSLCREISEGQTIASTPDMALLAPMEQFYPPQFTGIRGAFQTLSFVCRQMLAEIVFRKKLGNRQTIHDTVESRCQITVRTLSKDETRVLEKETRRNRTPMNSLIQAAMMSSVADRFYPDQTLPMRGISFADMRPFLKPPMDGKPLGVYISMLIYAVDMSPTRALHELAKDIQSQLYRASKSADKFIAPLLSRHLMGMLVKRKSMRMGMIALSFAGPMKLSQNYGTTNLVGLSGFVSNNVLGPELAAYGKIINGQLSIDFLSLDKDMDRSTAEAVADSVMDKLRNL